MQRSEITDLRLLLVQARDESHIEAQEQDCFVERCKIDRNQLDAVNVVRDEPFDSWLDAYDGIMIGGAGLYSATGNYLWMEPLLRLVRTICERRLPLFGSCWGHQIIARALGGIVEVDRTRAEIGGGQIRLTDAGRIDPLFGMLPDVCLVNMGHHDRVVELPANAVELAYNESQRNQAFRIKDLEVYGTQFHSELDARRERERLVEYRDDYEEDFPEGVSFDQLVASLPETTDADDLLYYFVTESVLHA